MTAAIACTLALSLAESGLAGGSARAQTPKLTLEFAPQADQFAGATAEYRAVWAAEGDRIAAAMERATGLRFERGPIRAIVYEGVSSSGYHDTPMQLRASYPRATKQATLVHELGHRLISDLLPKEVEQHPILFLFLYDVWLELWGKEFADQQVVVESQRRGVYDYESAWKAALALTPAGRAARFNEFTRQRRQ